MPKNLLRPIVEIVVASFAIADGRLSVAVVRRDAAPFARRSALISGPVRGGDRDANAAATRLVREQAGDDHVQIEQLMTFAGPDRDPRGWSVAVAYLALVRAAPRIPERYVPVNAALRLAFDHDRILAAALERLRGKSTYSTLPAMLLPDTFTLPQLKAVYETVIGTSLNDSAFRRKMSELRIVEPIAEQKVAATAVRRRPAQIYRLVRPGVTAFDRTI